MNYIGAQGVRALAAALGTNRSLKHLRLLDQVNSTDIGPRGRTCSHQPARSPGWRVEAATRFTAGGLPRQAALPASLSSLSCKQPYRQGTMPYRQGTLGRRHILWISYSGTASMAYTHPFLGQGSRSPKLPTRTHFPIAHAPFARFERVQMLSFTDTLFHSPGTFLLTFITTPHTLLQPHTPTSPPVVPLLLLGPLELRNLRGRAPTSSFTSTKRG